MALSLRLTGDLLDNPVTPGRLAQVPLPVRPDQGLSEKETLLRHYGEPTIALPTRLYLELTAVLRGLRDQNPIIELTVEARLLVCLRRPH